MGKENSPFLKKKVMKLIKYMITNSLLSEKIFSALNKTFPS